VPLLLGNACQKVIGRRVLKREEGELTVAVEPGDDPRRPAAEASLVVVEKEWATRHHSAGR
jgi:hypothetical protein